MAMVVADTKFHSHQRVFYINQLLPDNLNRKGASAMSGKTDLIKGRIKEAAGALTGNDQLRREGKTDQAVGKVKQVGEKAVAKVDQAVKKVRK